MMSRTRSLAAACVLLLAAGGACEPSAVEPQEIDLTRCQQTAELANFGCARVEGRVLNTAGQPVVGAFVALWGPDDAARGGFDFPVRKTAADGRFALEVHRFSLPAVAVQPDTVTMYLEATYAPTPGTPPVTSGRVPVLMQVKPVNIVAVVAQKDVTIATP